MAEEVAIPGVDYRPKVRSPLAVALLPFVTFGIYTFVWYYKVNKEMAALGRARGKTDELGDDPGKSLLAITLGALVIVPAIISTMNTFKRIQATQRLLRGGEVINGWLGLVLYLVFSPAMFAYMQSGLNSSWQAAVGGGQHPYPTGQYPAGQLPTGQYPQAQYPGQYAPTQNPAQNPAGQFPPAQYPTAQYPPAQNPAGQYQSGQYQSGQYPAAPAQYPPAPDQYPPTPAQYPPAPGQYQAGQQYPPAQYPTGQYPDTAPPAPSGQYPGQ